MRKALLVGINHYEYMNSLYGCVADAHDVEAVLKRNADGTLNFKTPRLLVGTDADSAVSRADLRNAIRELFEDDAEIALFYFAGHGYIEETGGYLCASDTASGSDGVPLGDVMDFANRSPARNKVIVLDSCHSGSAGSSNMAAGMTVISDGVTILTASTENQYAVEENGSGLFTNLFVDALNGAAANLVGSITPGSVYAHIDQSLGPWKQRPVFKTNVRSFVSLRSADAPIELGDLQKLTQVFPEPDYHFPLDPAYEPHRSSDELADPATPPPDPAKNATFEVLQKYVRVNLVRPVGAEHMYFAAMESKSCQLTVLGQHYWQLVKQDLL
jgi:hypothetical protein